jgi:hypothetical protein
MARPRSTSGGRHSHALPEANLQREHYHALWEIDIPRVGMTILPVGSDIRRISDPSGSGTNLYPRVLPVPDS